MSYLAKASLKAGVLVLVITAASTTFAGPKVHLGRSWPSDQRVAMDQVDHTAWDRLLGKYVDSDGFVDYRAWQASQEDRASLQNYLADLSRASPAAPASREARLAFWINAYNAVTIEGILQKYPLKSIREFTPKLWGYHIWHDLLLTVGAEQFSLDSIEHKILRPMGEPRIHFAIVCASVGCPRLLNQAYVPDRLDEQLAANTRHFFADADKFRYDRSRRRLELSKILEWFRDDFGADQTEMLRRIEPWLPDAAAQQLATSGQVTVSYLEYDWGLNDQARRP